MPVSWFQKMKMTNFSATCFKLLSVKVQQLCPILCSFWGSKALNTKRQNCPRWKKSIWSRNWQRPHKLFLVSSLANPFHLIEAWIPDWIHHIRTGQLVHMIHGQFQQMFTIDRYAWFRRPHRLCWQPPVFKAMGWNVRFYSSHDLREI